MYQRIHIYMGLKLGPITKVLSCTLDDIHLIMLAAGATTERSVA